MNATWEQRYEHDKAIRDTWCKSVGVSIPVDKKYGKLRHPKGFWKKWNGAEFYKLLNETVHTSIDFHKCKCRHNDNPMCDVDRENIDEWAGL